MNLARPPRLRPGDRVRLVSPASTPERERVLRGVEILTGWGLRVEVGAHAFDSMGHYLAGTDADRLADLNAALVDPGIRAVFSTMGGKGAYRIAHALDFAAVRRDPKPLIGFSDITILHLARWKEADAGGFHGPHAGWSDSWYGAEAAEDLRRALMEPAPATLSRDPREPTAAVVCEGTAAGILMGGNLGMIGMAVGWICPRFAGAILLLEAIDMYIGHVDRTLTQLLRSGMLDGVSGVAIGQFIRCGEDRRGKWSVVDVLQDRLAPLGVPILGGLPIGHGQHPPTVPLGTMATLDTAAATLTVEPGVA
jgi:muramoyltetrapeptide carboxypeptidase